MDFTTFRLNYTNDTANKSNNAVNTYCTMSGEAKSKNMMDDEVVGKTSSADEDENKYNLDGTLKEETGKAEKSGKSEKASKTDNPFTKENDSKIDNNNTKKDGFEKDPPDCQCETCRKRRYQDGSDDSGVSCQNPTKMDPTTASFKVKSHEMEHVRREQMKAKEDGKKVISQSVQIKTAICPECGRTYVSGGTTRTVTKTVGPEFYELFRVGAEDITKGDSVDATA